MISKLALIALAALTGPMLTASEHAAAQTMRSAGGDYILRDIIITSYRGSTAVSSGRTDARGNFRLDAPAGVDRVCLNGPSLRSAINRAGGGDPQRAETLVELLVVVAVNDQPQQRLPFPSGRGGDCAGGRASADLDLCYRPFVNVGSNETHTERAAISSGSASPDRGEGLRRTDPPPIVADTSGDGRVSVAVGDLNGDGTADRRVDPRIPPPAARSGTAGPATPGTVLTGTVSLAR